MTKLSSVRGDDQLHLTREKQSQSESRQKVGGKVVRWQVRIFESLLPFKD